jgi:choline ABC transporter choline binding protein
MPPEKTQESTHERFTLVVVGRHAESASPGPRRRTGTVQTVNFSDVGWTDITVTTATTSEILKGLGYKPRTTMISVPVTYKSLADGKDMDVFLGNWMPTMENDIKQYRDAGTVETVRANLENAKYTLAVPEALYDKGLKDFADIAKFKEELGGKIYGIEPGNDGNRTIQSMIDKNAFGLKDAGFKVVESSEAGMLSQVERAQARPGHGVPRLGTAPDEHPLQDEVPDRRRRLVRPQLRPGHHLHQHPQGLHPGMQQRGPVAEKPVVHPEHGKHPDG